MLGFFFPKELQRLSLDLRAVDDLETTLQLRRVAVLTWNERMRCRGTGMIPTGGMVRHVSENNIPHVSARYWLQVTIDIDGIKFLNSWPSCSQ